LFWWGLLSKDHPAFQKNGMNHYLQKKIEAKAQGFLTAFSLTLIFTVVSPPERIHAGGEVLDSLF